MKPAVIPARGGINRVSRKNIREFSGRPMITWAIEPARKSRCFEQVIISTGDAENADISHQWGADTDEDWHRADLMLRALSKIEEW